MHTKAITPLLVIVSLFSLACSNEAKAKRQIDGADRAISVIRLDAEKYAPAEYRDLMVTLVQAKGRLAAGDYAAALTIAKGVEAKAAAVAATAADKKKTTRTRLPFNIQWDGEMTTGPTMFNLDMEANATPVADVPLSGTIKWLEVDGVRIALADHNVKNGLLQTTDFGVLEFVETPKGTEVRGTASQQDAIKNTFTKR